MKKTAQEKVMSYGEEEPLPPYKSAAENNLDRIQSEIHKGMAKSVVEHGIKGAVKGAVMVAPGGLPGITVGAVGGLTAGVGKGFFIGGAKGVFKGAAGVIKNPSKASGGFFETSIPVELNGSDDNKKIKILAGKIAGKAISNPTFLKFNHSKATSDLQAMVEEDKRLLAKVIDKKLNYSSSNGNLNEHDIEQLSRLKERIVSRPHLQLALDDANTLILAIPTYKEEYNDRLGELGRIQNQALFCSQVQKGFVMLGKIGEIVGSQSLQRTSVIGQAAFSVVEKVHHFRALSASSAFSSKSIPTFELFSSLFSIGSAAYTLIGMFRKKKNRGGGYEAVLTQQLQSLSYQIHELREDINAKFGETHRNQMIIFDAMCRGFEMVYYSTQLGLQEIKSSILKELDKIKGQLHDIQAQVLQASIDSQIENLNNIIHSIDNEYRTFKDTRSFSDSNFYMENNRVLNRWLFSTENALSKCQSDILNSLSDVDKNTSLSQLSESQLINCIKFLSKKSDDIISDENEYSSSGFGLLKNFAEKLFKQENEDLSIQLRDLGKTANVEIWEKAIGAYVKLKQLGVALNYPLRNEFECDQIRKFCENIKQILDFLIQNQNIIIKGLLSHYKMALESLQNETLSINANNVQLQKTRNVGSNFNPQINIDGASVSLSGSNIDSVLANMPGFLSAVQGGLGSIDFTSSISTTAHHDPQFSNNGVRVHGGGRGFNAWYPHLNIRIECYFTSRATGRRVLLATGQCPQIMGRYVEYHNQSGYGNCGNNPLYCILPTDPCSDAGYLYGYHQPIIARELAGQVNINQRLSEDQNRNYSFSATNFSSANPDMSVLQDLAEYPDRAILEHQSLRTSFLRLEFYRLLAFSFIELLDMHSQKVYEFIQYALPHSNIIKARLGEQFSQNRRISEAFEVVKSSIEKNDLEIQNALSIDHHQYSPLLYSVYEKMGELGLLFNDTALIDFAPCPSDDESDELIDSFEEEYKISRKSWRREKKEDFASDKDIGTGAYATVFQGSLLKSGKNIPVAIKTILASHVDNANQTIRKLFIDETKNMSIVQKKNCQNVIGFFGTSRHKNKIDGKSKYSILMELGEESLGSYLDKIYKKEKDFLSPAEQKKICLELAKGLAEIHKAKILHKDIKDANILLVKNRNASFGYTIKLADLGLGQFSNQTLLAHSTTIKDREGTLIWHAPEVSMGAEHSYDSDIFSLGLVMWRVLHQGRPIASLTDADVLPLDMIKLKELYRDNLEARLPFLEQDEHGFNKILELCWKHIHEITKVVDTTKDQKSMNKYKTHIKKIDSVESRASAADLIKVIENIKLPDEKIEFLSNTENKIFYQENENNVNGLQFEKIHGDGHCFYNAVALYLDPGKECDDPVAILRGEVADYIQNHPDEFNEILQDRLVCLDSEKTIDDLVNEIRSGNEWADNEEIEILSRILTRRIVIIQDGSIREGLDLNRFEDTDPVFVHYNGHDHYDAYILTGELSTDEILGQLQDHVNRVQP